MEYTANEVAAISARLLDAFIRKQAKVSDVENKPTMNHFVAGMKEFGATKENVSLPIRLKHGNDGTNDGLVGIGPGDQVKFYNPASDRRAIYPRKKHHIGCTYTEDEMEDGGVTITDEWGKTSGGSTGGDHAVLINVVESKAADFNEQHDDKFNEKLWDDGTLDPQGFAGIRAFILDDPTSGTVGGISCALNTKWRNRAYTTAHGTAGGTGAITSNTAGGGELMQILHKDNRQLRRFGGKVDFFDGVPGAAPAP